MKRRVRLRENWNSKLSQIRYGRWCPCVNLLGLIMLFIALPAQGQGGGTHATLEQVNQAVRETQREAFETS